MNDDLEYGHFVRITKGLLKGSIAYYDDSVNDKKALLIQGTKNIEVPYSSIEAVSDTDMFERYTFLLQTLLDEAKLSKARHEYFTSTAPLFEELWMLQEHLSEN